MERAMFWILLFLGNLCNFVSFLHRQYHFIKEPKTWPEAQQHCREKHTDLATVNDEQDVKELTGLVEPGVSRAFLGLHRSWGWSLSDADDYKEGEPAFWNWASGRSTTHYCGSMRLTGRWFATNCSATLNFFCYDGSAADISKRFSLGNGSMNWLHAQSYCRKLHTDLARVRSQFENKALQGIVNNGSVWIGLTRTSWMWSDGSEPSFVPWTPLEPRLSGPADCGALDVSSNPVGMTDVGCDGKLPFFCYSAPLRKHLLGLKLTADDSSVDMKDPAVMESVLKSVERYLRDKGASEDVKLSWLKLPEKDKNSKQEQTETREVICVP